MEEGGFTLTLELKQGYEFSVDFEHPGIPSLLMDEPPPLGEDHGPNASRLLAAAVGNCLSASALFCLRKARVPVRGMHTTVQAALERNPQGRLRIAGIQVKIQSQVAPEDRDRMGRCLGIFEEFCVVTQSVRGGIDVKVDVEPASG
ncbi:MAG: OsmC family protein [candidate division NC10 bacterium]|nr:OsmC family protein [candidate division NC10 bacterium]